ncbi:PTS transporter subunit IIC [uncultured Fusobacterium sp.]|uniref:PTS galactitol transporter subunit IIC n=1 Tax=uncultured Fusobacterium sp. TaxID=159267 RepID=UPI0015A5D964|nr:PTS transporter subunit IIC [uncultured Fusobacterium sp.]
MGIIQALLGMGAVVVLPLIIFIIGLFFKLRAKDAFKSGLTIGIGFVGINLVIGMLVGNLGTATQQMSERFNLNLTTMDVGWPVESAISFATPLVIWVFILALVINIVMLAMNWTNVMNVDLWNFWHFIFTGALVYYTTNSMVLALIATAISIVIIIKLADWAAPIISKYFGMEGVTFAHMESINWLPVGYGINKLIDCIPGIRNIDIRMNSGENKNANSLMSIFGDPAIMGLLLGGIIGALAGYGWKEVLSLAINLAAVMFLMPRMVKILMEGLVPLSEAAQEFMNARFPGRKVYIGLDGAIAIGDPGIMSVGVIMVPISLLLAVILPGNTMLPFADLGIVPILLTWAIIPAKGNMFRALISSIVVMSLILLIGSSMAPLLTSIAKQVGFAIPEGAGSISALDGGSHVLSYVLWKIFSIF